MFQAALLICLTAVASASSYASQYGSNYAKAYSYEPAHITVLPNGHLADTPEVAIAKGDHHVAKAIVAAAAAANPDYGSYSTYSRPSYEVPAIHVAPVAIYVSPATATYSPALATYVSPAPATYVAPIARSSKFIRHYAVSPYRPYAGVYSHYTPAHITVLSNGYLADTPEVAQAKGAHKVAKAYAAVNSHY